VGFTTGSRGKVPGKTCENKGIVIIPIIIIITNRFSNTNG
jgi:hypothetical protein